MEKDDYLNYDERVDHLIIYKSREQIVFNIDTGLAIFSLNSKKEIVGIEFLGANKNFKIPKEILENLSGCNVEIKYSPENSKIDISISKKQHTIEILISDQGPGIPKKDIPHIFESFYRGDKAR